MTSTGNSINQDLEAFLRTPSLHPAHSSSYVSLNQNILDYLSEQGCDEYIHFDLLGYDFRVLNLSFGAVSSLDLFGLFELLLFAYYKRSISGLTVADIGANIGVHTLAMLQSNASMVHSYEPDYLHAHPKLVENLRVNAIGVERQATIAAAVSSNDTRAEFIRTLGNTTSSHLSGLKVPYGQTETLQVDVVDFGNIVSKYAFAKIDAEGAEADILGSIHPSSFNAFSCFIEIGSHADRSKIESVFSLFEKNSIFFYPQLLGWEKASTVDDLPFHWSQGNCFIGLSPPIFSGDI